MRTASPDATVAPKTMILLVDDDPGFLDRAATSLADSRRVFFARNAEQAKDLMEAAGDAFQVALIDLDLRATDPFGLIRELRASWPELPIIAITGVAKPQLLEDAKAMGAVETLRKPITSEWNAAVARARSRNSVKTA